jgi:hypothetical protein
MPQHFHCSFGLLSHAKTVAFDMAFVCKGKSVVQLQKVVDGDSRLPTVPSSTDAV